MKNLICSFLLFFAFYFSSFAQNPCGLPQHSQFDFWVGDWNVYKTNTDTIVGFNKIEKILNGCVVFENWKGGTGFEGKSFNTYNPQDSTWNQVWVDVSGVTYHFKGRFENNVMTMKGTTVGRLGKFSHPQILKSSNPQILKSSNPQILKSSNPQIFKSSNFQILKSSNPQILKSSVMIQYYSINGKLVHKDDAYLKVNDLALMRGYGVFDFFRTQKGKAVFLNDHLDRFENSANYLGLEIPYSRVELTQKIEEVIKFNHLENACIRLVLTGGYSPDGFSPGVPNLIIMAHPLTTYPEDYYTKGIKLMLFEYVRETPYTKTTNYLIPIRLQKEIKAAEASDVLYHDGKFISESSRSNFFIVNAEGTVITPDKDALEGITRKHIMEIARNRFKLEVRPISIQETLAAREAFITSTTKGVMPVRQIDGVLINKGIVGKTTKELMKLLKEEVETSFASISV